VNKVILMIISYLAIIINLHAVSLEEKINTCSNGNPQGCTYLGNSYAKGEDVKQDYKQAIKFYKKGCDGGSGQGCCNLGMMYEKGNGTEQNIDKAIELYTKGCEIGHIQGCTYLGNFYYYGNGVEQDLSKAIELYTKGCENENIAGCIGVGVTYAVMGQYEKAKVYFKKGCDSGNEQACRYYIKADEESSSNMNIPLWGIIVAGVVFLFIILALIFGRKNEKVKDILGWIIGIPLIALFWYYSSLITTWWTAFKLSYFGF